MSILMQAPANLGMKTVASSLTISGISYVVNADGQVLADPRDVGILSGLGFVALVLPMGKSISATAYILQLSDINRKLAFTASGAVTLTIPDDLILVNVDAEVLIQQIGAGQVTPTGTDIRNSQSHTKTAAQNAQAVLSTIPGVANAWILAGDTA